MAWGVPQRESTLARSFVLRFLISLLQVGILGEVSGEGFNGIFISSPGIIKISGS